MQPFIVTFRFATMPVVRRGACTLDAVLGGEIARTVDDRDEAIRLTPLARTDDVCHGSSLMLLGDVGVTQNVPVVQKSRAAFAEIDPAQVSRGRRRVDKPWAKNLLHTYEARICEGGAWLGVGRLDEVAALLHTVVGIGKRRQSGWGMIDPESLAVEPVDGADPASWGLVSRPDDPDFATDRIVPRRPLPLELFRTLGGDPLDEVIAVERVRQPYYDAANPPEPAVVPWT